MGQESPNPYKSASEWEDVKQTEEIFLKEKRNQRYKELLGQFPPSDMEDEDIIKALLDLEEGERELLRRNKRDDDAENIRNFRR